MRGPSAELVRAAVPLRNISVMAEPENLVRYAAKKAVAAGHRDHSVPAPP